jgi:hypothetical protein
MIEQISSINDKVKERHGKIASAEDNNNIDCCCTPAANNNATFHQSKNYQCDNKSYKILGVKISHGISIFKIKKPRQGYPFCMCRKFGKKSNG